MNEKEQEEIQSILMKASSEGEGYFFNGYTSRKNLEDLPESEFRTACLNVFDAFKQYEEAKRNLPFDADEYSC